MNIEAVRIGAEDEQPASGALGYVDHAPFAGFGVNLAYGELSDGTIISIAKAARGRACQCVCPACRANLIARKGDELAHHFAHDGLGMGCGFGPETNAHIWAKEVLERELKIMLPARYIVDEGGKRQVTGAAQFFEFVAAKLERRVGRIVPDVILTAPDGREFVVEVKVTHASTQAKKDEMRESNLPGIEVNLRAFRTSTDEEAVRDALLFNAPRTWLHNARIADDQAKFDAEVERKRLERERQAQERERRKQEQIEAERQKVIARADAIISQLQNANDFAEVVEAETQCRAEALGLGEFLEPLSDTTGFTVPDHVWQAALLEWLADSVGTYSYIVDTVTIEDALGALAQYIRVGFQGEIADDVRTQIRKLRPGWTLPFEAIEQYLWSLQINGLLEQGDYENSFALASHWRSRIQKAQRDRQALDGRRANLKATLSEILDELPAEEVGNFDPEIWLTSTLSEFGASPLDLANFGNENWTKFYLKLSALAAMRRGGDTDVFPLGLPVESAIGRAVDARLDAARLEAERRAASLREQASEILGSEATGWLNTHCAKLCMTPIAAALFGEAEFGTAYTELFEEDRARRIAKRNEEVAQGFKAKLQAAVKSSKMPADESRMFLTNFHPDLNASPLAYCSDQAGLDRCVKLLNVSIRRGGRRFRVG